MNYFVGYSQLQNGFHGNRLRLLKTTSLTVAIATMSPREARLAEKLDVTST